MMMSTLQAYTQLRHVGSSAICEDAPQTGLVYDWGVHRSTVIWQAKWSRNRSTGGLIVALTTSSTIITNSTFQRQEKLCRSAAFIKSDAECSALVFLINLYRCMTLFGWWARLSCSNGSSEDRSAFRRCTLESTRAWLAWPTPKFSSGQYILTQCALIK